VIVGTAGHIDHGKTSLVRALTGIETDRLKQEQEQGISIELGYAYDASGGPDQLLGFVDVPGHERLVHTMAAGATGIDFGLLVVAADDGVMPQTREHLAILNLLDVHQGAIAITKTDRVDTERVAQVKSELIALVAGTFLNDAPIFAVCLTGNDDSKVQRLRSHLQERARTRVQRAGKGLFRLAVDRVFTMQGHGTVVTGTVHSGQFHLNNDSTDLRLMPSGIPVRVRSLHAQNQVSTSGIAGQRCALNLAGLSRDQIARGDWIADVRCFIPSANVDVNLSILVDSDVTVGTWTVVHVHVGAAHYVANVVPLSSDNIFPGESAKAQLVFNRPVCVMAGDRFIVRNAQARLTIGGGMVLDPNAPDRKRRSPARLAWLDGVAALQDTGSVSTLLEQAAHGLDEAVLLRLAGGISDLAVPADAMWTGEPDSVRSGTLILTAHWRRLADIVTDALDHFHQTVPNEPGVDASRLKRVVLPTLADDLWGTLIDRLLGQGEIVRNGPWLHRPGHEVTFADSERILAQRLLTLIHAGAFDPPWTRELAHETGYDEDLVRHLLHKLLRQGLVFQVVRDLFYHREQTVQLARLVATLGDESGVHAAEFRDATGLGRKRAIQILEFFGRQGYTRRHRDRHRVRPESTCFEGLTE